MGGQTSITTGTVAPLFKSRAISSVEVTPPIKISALSVLSVDKKIGCERQPTPSLFVYFVVKKRISQRLAGEIEWFVSFRRFWSGWNWPLRNDRKSVASGLMLRRIVSNARFIERLRLTVILTWRGKLPARKFVEFIVAFCSPVPFP